MTSYRFELLLNGAVVAAWRDARVNGAAGVWLAIQSLARTLEGPGYDVRVRDAAGEIVVQTGVASVRRFAKAL